MPEAIASRAITIDNGRGERLAARLDVPASGTPRASALLAHCFTCSKDLKALRSVAHALAAEGFAVLRLDFTGLGASEGAFEATTFSTNVADLVAGARCLREEVPGPQVFVGHSLGGAAVLAAALLCPEARAVATVGAPAAPAHVVQLLEGGLEALERDGRAQVDIGGRPFTVRRELVDDLRAANLPAAVADLGRPLLILHAPSDRTVGIDEARRLFEAARHPKSFVALDGADHLLSDPRDAAYVGRLVAAWASRYVLDAAGPRDQREAAEHVAQPRRDDVPTDRRAPAGADAERVGEGEVAHVRGAVLQVRGDEQRHRQEHRHVLPDDRAPHDREERRHPDQLVREDARQDEATPRTGGTDVGVGHLLGDERGQLLDHARREHLRHGERAAEEPGAK